MIVFLTLSEIESLATDPKQIIIDFRKSTSVSIGQLKPRRNLIDLTLPAPPALARDIVLKAGGIPNPGVQPQYYSKR